MAKYEMIGYDLGGLSEEEDGPKIISVTLSDSFLAVRWHDWPNFIALLRK